MFSLSRVVLKLGYFLGEFTLTTITTGTHTF
jgi:hypothetical protein